MTDEAGFLAHILAAPADAVARLAYADWLEEQGDPASQRKADYLRTDARLAELTEDSPVRDRLVSALRLLAAGLPVEWKTATARLPLENCSLRWDFVCPKQWDRLAPTDDPEARHCSACERRVDYCGSLEEARERAWAGYCVAVDLTVLRRPGDLDPPVPEPRMVISGAIMADYSPPEPERPRHGLRAWLRRRLLGREGDR